MSEYMELGNWDDRAPETVNSRCLKCGEVYSRDVDDMGEDYCSEECFIDSQQSESAAEAAAQRYDEEQLAAECANAGADAKRPTPREVAALVASWERDPCWDLSDTEDFEAWQPFLREVEEAYAAENERVTTFTQAEAIAWLGLVGADQGGDVLNRFRRLARLIRSLEPQDESFRAMQEKLREMSNTPDEVAL